MGNNLLGQGRRWKGKVKGGIKEREEKGSLYFYGEEKRGEKGWEGEGEGRGKRV